MTLIERIKQLEAAATPSPWTIVTSFTEIDDRLMEEMRNILPKLLAVVGAAECVYYNHLLPAQETTWSTDASELRDALAALEQNEKQKG